MEWDPSRFFRASGSPTPYAILVLNQPINEKAFAVLGEHASYIICADGGANRLYDMLRGSSEESQNLPNAIVGDLDSIRPSVREHYEALEVSILEDPDQYSTDFTKCLEYLNAHAAEIIASPRRGVSTTEGDSDNTASASTSVLEIVILGGLGGRVDQAFSQIHHLYMMTQTQHAIREAHDHGKGQTMDQSQQQTVPPAAGGNLYLISEESITFILQTGKNTIYTPATKRADLKSPLPNTEPEPEPEYFFEENIGIIPLSGPASITTHGFEWDVQDWHTEIGGQLSTSNHIRSDTVHVETSVPVVFTVELAARLKRK
ncbi:hypothetical protein NUU61_002412 [Penicillium alfredii]|uniref:Thiamine pyrophosphokinase n=1 Tax=Penicillium alfredii TaxID=1506179 RepID=A0A9W9FS81_9EURO|nr:uncharacterized protein NUU61_002412 [Penicillium alfredii]KAJ5105065.1 hypothetical protein NUU61_002412 [Penicillium alfredii]